jgi:hypothetical protein
MFRLPSLKASVERLTELELGLAAELAAWKDAKHPLTLTEAQWDVGFLERGRAALHHARDSLALAVKRLREDQRAPGRRQG